MVTIYFIASINSNILNYLWSFHICYKVINNWFVSSCFPSKFMNFFVLKNVYVRPQPLECSDVWPTNCDGVEASCCVPAEVLSRWGTDETGMARSVGPCNRERPEYEGWALPPHHLAQFLDVKRRTFQSAVNEHLEIRRPYLCVLPVLQHALSYVAPWFMSMDTFCSEDSSCWYEGNSISKLQIVI